MRCLCGSPLCCDDYNLFRGVALCEECYSTLYDALARNGRLGNVEEGQ